MDNVFDFTIHYWIGRSNKAANALSRHLHDDDSKIEIGSDSDEVGVILCSSGCEVVNSYLDTTKIPDDLKKEALSISCAIQPILEEKDAEEIEGMLNSVSVLDQVTPEDVAEEQKKDPILQLVCLYVAAGKN